MFYVILMWETGLDNKVWTNLTHYEYYILYNSRCSNKQDVDNLFYLGDIHL